MLAVSASGHLLLEALTGGWTRWWLSGPPGCCSRWVRMRPVEVLGGKASGPSFRPSTVQAAPMWRWPSCPSPTRAAGSRGPGLLCLGSERPSRDGRERTHCFRTRVTARFGGAAGPALSGLELREFFTAAPQRPFFPAHTWPLRGVVAGDRQRAKGGKSGALRSDLQLSHLSLHDTKQEEF